MTDICCRHFEDRGSRHRPYQKHVLLLVVEVGFGYEHFLVNCDGEEGQFPDHLSLTARYDGFWRMYASRGSS